MIVTLASSASAETPHLMHYQGYLTNSNGTPIHCPNAEVCPDDEYDVTFRFYEDVSGGIPLWIETHEAVSVVQGTFDLELGSTAPIDLEDLADPTYLGVEINGTGELSPRQRVVSAAFAMRSELAEIAELAISAEDAQALGGVPAADYATIAALPGLCVTTEALSEVLNDGEYMNPADVSVFLTEEGYVPGDHLTTDDVLELLALEGYEAGPIFSGQWEDVSGKPEFASVATSGSFLDLSDLPSLVEQADIDVAGNFTYNGLPIVSPEGVWIGSPTGLAGTEGPVGPAGPPGEAGEAGEAGPQGDPGADGPPGADGAPGVDGQPGEKGEQGDPGLAGEAGETGADGADGADGAPGAPGPKGDQGAAGVAGAAGTQGPSGPQGPAGPQGPQGIQGPQGVQGAQGPVGVQGPPGEDGFLAGQVCANGEILRWNAGLWSCSSAVEEVTLDNIDTAGASPGDVLAFEDGQVVWSEINTNSADAVFNAPFGVKLGVDPPACTPAQAGTIHYDADNETIAVCDGTQLKRFIAVCGAGCPTADTVTCGDAIVDSCGTECPGTGTQCAGDGACIDGTCYTCGNGILNDGEECDDGNIEGGDGCSAFCSSEVGIDVSLGNRHTCMLMPSGQAMCWGDNAAGQCDVLPGAYKKLSPGRSHTCAITLDDELTCWGSNQFGQILDLPAGQFKDVDSGNYHICAVDFDGVATCWGKNTDSQCSVPEGKLFMTVNAGDGATCGILDDGSLLCWGSASYGMNMPPTGAFEQLDLSSGHACAIRTNGWLACWGWDGYGEVSNAPYGAHMDIAAGAYHSCAVDMFNNINCWGLGSAGQVDVPEGTYDQVDAGSHHTCGRTLEDQLVCWGSNQYGQSMNPPEDSP
jgi:cysteine-rich repeat protein